MSGGFAVELEKLQKIHAKKLPLAIGNLDDALAGVDRASSEAFRAFSGHADLCADVERQWVAASLFLYRVMKRNRDMLNLTREALAQVEQRYRELDGAD